MDKELQLQCFNSNVEQRERVKLERQFRHSDGLTNDSEKMIATFDNRFHCRVNLLENAQIY